MPHLGIESALETFHGRDQVISIPFAQNEVLCVGEGKERDPLHSAPGVKAED